MEFDTRWYGLGIAVLILFAILIPRYFKFRSVSDRHAHEVCQTIYSTVKTYQTQGSGEAEWERLQDDAMPQLETIALDIEGHLHGRTPASIEIYQLAKYELPRAIQRRGLIADAKLDERLADILQLIDVPAKSLVLDVQHHKAAQKPVAWDPVIIGILVIDGVLLMIGTSFVIRRFQEGDRFA